MKSSFVVDAGLDRKTLEELAMLRDIRLGLVKKQLADVEGTINELVRRKLIPASEREEFLVEARAELENKLERLKNLHHEECNLIHFDELELYIDLLELPPV